MAARFVHRVGFAAVLAWASEARAGEPGITAAPDVDPIVGGEPTEDGEFDDVVSIRTPGGYRCSGVVVSPRVVLTAAHCLVDLRDTDTVRVAYGSQDGEYPEIDAVEFGSYPTYDSNPQHQDIHDYGYVLLATDFTVPGGYVPMITTQDEWDEAMVEGRAVILVGWGETGGGITTSGTKRKVTTTIRRFSAAGLEFFAGGDQQDTCGGDSGGPAYVRMDDGTLRVAGITSRGGEVCGTGGWYGTPYAALCWVDEHTNAGLSDPTCNTCDCLDTTPDDEGRCSMGNDPDDGDAWPLAALLLLVLIRRRRARILGVLVHTLREDGV